MIFASVAAGDRKRLPAVLMWLALLFVNCSISVKHVEIIKSSCIDGIDTANMFHGGILKLRTG